MTAVAEVMPTLEENEAVIERGMSSFVDVGRALQRVRDSSQYIEAGFDTFEDYCEKRWDLRSTQVNELRAAARVVGLLETTGGTDASVPRSQRSVMPLVRLMNDVGRFDKATNELRDPEAAKQAVVTAWRQVLDRRGGAQIRERDVRDVISPAVSAGKPNWGELLGRVGEELKTAQKHLDRFEQEIGDKTPTDKIRMNAGRYAEWAESIATRLRHVQEES